MQTGTDHESDTILASGSDQLAAPRSHPPKKNSNLPSIPLWRRRPGVSQPSKKTGGGRQMRPAQR